MSVRLGQIIYIAVKPIFKIYLIIGVGFLLTRKNILTVETSKNISTIAINVLIPCLAFQKIVTNISNSDIHQIATIVIISFFIMGLGSILCFTFGVAAGCPKYWWGGLICCGLLPNISDLPIAYLQTMESSSVNVFNDIDKGVSYVMIYLTLQMLVQFNFGAFKLIEMDFHTEAKMNSKKQNNDLVEDKENQSSKETETTDDTAKSLYEPSESDMIPQPANPSIIVTPPPPTQQVVTSNSADSASSSITSLSSTNTSLSSLRNAQLQPILRTSTTATNSTLDRPLSRTLSVPRVILGHDIIPQPEEGMSDIIRVYSRYAVLEPLSNNVRETTEQAESFIRSIVDLIKGTDYRNLFKAIINLWIAATLKVVSITLVISIAFCMIPWVQALFVNTPQASLPSAPDGDPPLSFIMDFASYIGAAEVPFGLLMLGGTIGRLNMKNIPLRVWKVPIAVTFARLFIMPIIGCAFNSKLYHDGLFYKEDILYFISNINFCLPPATSLLYITAMYTPVDNNSHIQMDYLALVYIFHYIFLVVCLPFTTTYTMKIPLHF